VRDVLQARGIDTHDGSELPGAGHILLLTAEGEETYDLVRDVVADLGLGLVRMEQRRHHISEVFKDSDDQALRNSDAQAPKGGDEQRKEAVGHGG
jgi:ABC-2 type transport system ATP-binding protein